MATGGVEKTLRIPIVEFDGLDAERVVLGEGQVLPPETPVANFGVNKKLVDNPVAEIFEPHNTPRVGCGLFALALIEVSERHHDGLGHGFVGFGFGQPDANAGTGLPRQRAGFAAYFMLPALRVIENLRDNAQTRQLRPQIRQVRFRNADELSPILAGCVKNNRLVSQITVERFA